MKDTVENNLTFGPIDPALLDIVWSDVEPLLGKAIDTANGRFTPQAVREMLDQQVLILWVVADGTKPVAAITTRIIAYPECRGLALDWIGGTRMKEWLPIAMPIMQDYAKFQGCSHIEGYGRKAWDRWLKPYGWKPDYICYKLEVTNG